MLPSLLLVAILAPAGPQPPKPSAPAFVVDHQGVDCVVADKHPRLEARVPPGIEVATARIYFQGASQEWYSVAMKAEGPVFAGVLPAPKANLKEFHYYVEVTSKSLETARTADRGTRVVASSTDCRGLAAASVVSTASSILVQGPAGAAAVPSGFASTGLVAAGGGISGTTLAVAGAAVVGGGVVVATQMGGDDETQYAGPMSGELTIAFGPCTRVERYSLTLTMRLNGETGDVAGSQPGKYEVLSATPGCTTGPQTGATTPFGISETPVTRSGSALSFSYRESVPGSDTQVDFKGTLSGDVVSGTVTMVIRAPNATGTSVSTPLVSPVTLTAVK